VNGGATLSNQYYHGPMDTIFMPNGSKSNLFKQQSGQSLIEFALILPLMVLVIAGIFDLGRAFYASITITNAAREGARYGTLHPDKFSDIKTASVNEAQGAGIILNSGDISITCPDIVVPLGSCDRNQPLRVTVTYIYDDMILGFFLPEIEMNRFVEMLVP
jgi:Flp pilus assembly protein TadG